MNHMHLETSVSLLFSSYHLHNINKKVPKIDLIYPSTK